MIFNPNLSSLLASLGSGSGEPENPASPPSASNSPELLKATPTAAAKSEDQTESES
jgi:translation initiation factor 4G